MSRNAARTFGSLVVAPFAVVSFAAVSHVVMSLGVLALSATSAAADPLTSPIQAEQIEVQVVEADAAALDDLDEQAAVTQQRVQMKADRQATAQQAVSNLGKKLADTQGTVIQNIK